LTYQNKFEIESLLAGWRKNVSEISMLMGLADLAGHAIQLSEKLILEAESRLAAMGHTVRCTNGCGSCCRHVVPISPPEAFYLVDLVQKKEDTEVIFIFHEVLSKLASTGMQASSLMNQAQEYFTLGLPCPFLENESCSIHPFRPMACREHLVVSDPENCADFSSSKIQILPIFISLREALASVFADLTGTAPAMIPMVRMFDWVEDQKEYRNQEWDSAYLLNLFCAKIKNLNP
jgi:Fe-S-cluster containining protein